MDIKEEGSRTTFQFKGPGSRAGMLFLIQGFALISIAIALIWIAVNTFLDDRYGMTVFTLVLAVPTGWIGIRLLGRVATNEQLAVTKEALVITRAVAGKKIVTSYSVDRIANLCYVGPGAVATHAMASEHLDPLGFGMRQAVVNAVNTEGSIAFYYDAAQIRFGVGLSSWDAEAIDQKIRAYTGGQLSIAGLPDDIPEELWNKG